MKKTFLLLCQIIKRVLKNKIIKIGAIVFLIFTTFIIVLKVSLFVFPLPIDRLETDYSDVCLAKDDELLRITLSKEGRYRIKLQLNDISDYLKKGFLQYEDKYFYLHYGINPMSILRAVILNVKSKKIVSGGSTITMQIARMMEHSKGKRTLLLKLKEVFRALQLEARYSKDELLEIYLNTVPMGGNIEGVGAASYLYFGKPANHLSLGQSAILICLPRSPSQLRPDIYPDLTKQAREKVLVRITSKLNVPDKIIEEAKNEIIPARRFENPFLAPNLILRTTDISSLKIKRYTLDLSLQKYCENIIKKKIDDLKKFKVYNSAMIVVDNHTSEVIVYIGSADFNDLKHWGQINGASIKRSPGSLLKPFLYAKGVENGVITPKKVIFDVERNYDGYTPANFSKKYIGQVTANESLICSLNVPAVNLEYELRQNGLLGFLKDTRFVDEKQLKKDPGLSLVLGACPFTLEEMVRMYSCIANGGMIRELKFFKDDRMGNTGRSVLSKEACFIITEMLTEIERTDLPQCWEFTANRGRIAFKTGTSFGLKDAWCIGYNPDYTIGVWFGNMDCKGSTALVGIKVAAPIVVDIFNHLTRYRDTWFKKPDGVLIREVCVVSGEPAGPCCERKSKDYFIPGISSNKICSVHRLIHLRKSDRVEVCKFCMNGKPDEYEQKIVEIWPPDIASYLRKNGKKNDLIPKHNPRCANIDNTKGLKIKNPIKGGFYIISKALLLQEQKIALKVESNNVEEEVYWLFDNDIIASGSPDKTFFIEPKPGKHTITVMNLKGQYDTVTIHVVEEVSALNFNN